jgi:hypothetical protein
MDEKILNVVRKVNISSPDASRIRARLWQALSFVDAGFNFIRHFVVQFWITEMPLAEWEICLLGVLSKKGNLSNPCNYRAAL